MQITKHRKQHKTSNLEKYLMHFIIGVIGMKTATKKYKERFN